MNLDELRYFVEAAKEQNLSQAARVLGITQSTLSHAIRRLETELGRPLFAKEGKRVLLTLHGKKFAERAADLVNGIHSLKEEMSSSEAPLLGRFRVGCAPGVATRILARAWNRQARCSRAVLETSGMRSSEVLRRVAAKELDFGLCFDPQPYPDVRAVEIVRSPTRVAVRAGHPLTRAKRESDPQRLSRYPLATAKHLPGVIACSSHPIFQKVAEPVTVRYYFDSYDVAAEILATSDAWSILPLASIEESQGRLRALFPESYEWIQLKLVWNQSDEHSGLMEALISELGNAAKHFGWAVESVAGVPGRSGLRKKPEITDRQPKHDGVEA